MRVTTYIQEIMHNMLCVTDVYWRKIKKTKQKN